MSEETPIPPAETPNNVWPDWQKQLGVLALILAAALVLYIFRSVLYIFVYTLIIGFILNYPIKLLNKKLSYNLSVMLVYLVFVLLVFAGAMWLTFSLAETAVSALMGFQTVVNALIPSPQSFQVGPLDLSPILEPLSRLAAIGGSISLLTSSGIIDAILQAFGVLADFLGDLFVIVIIMLFFLMEKPRTIVAIGARLSAASRRETTILLTRLVNLFQNYLIGSLLIVGFYWLLATLQLWLTGVPNAVTYGFLIGLPNFIPSVGGFVSIILVFFITLFAGSETIVMNRLLFAFLEMAVFMLLAGTAYYLVNVRVYSRSVNIPVWVILIGLIAFGAAFGLLGILVAAAAIAMGGELLDFLLKKVRGEDPYPGMPEPGLFAENLALVEASKKPKKKKKE
ncbi:MAG: AI-2E family transporter [Chloroflexota bacterium]